MTSHTKKFAFLAAAVLAGAIAVAIFMVFEVRSQGEKLNQQLAVLSEEESKQLAFQLVERLVLESESERAIIYDSFFKSESDTIDLLNQLDDLALRSGLKIENNLEAVVDESQQQKIKLSTSFSGPKDKVINFYKILETLPYHSSLENLSLKETGAGSWQGSVTILITVQAL